MKRFLKELILCVFLFIPLIYLILVWNKLPVQVPIHFRLDGTVDRWSTKLPFAGILSFMTFGIYFILLFVPHLDPKNKIKQMGNKYFNFRLLITIFTSTLSIYMIYRGIGGNSMPSFLFILIGAFFIFLGNYLQTIPPNYFIGIRTPWTLESSTVWLKTHRLSGRLWMVSGFLILILGFTLFSNKIIQLVFFIIIFFNIFLTVGYSWFKFKKEKRESFPD